MQDKQIRTFIKQIPKTEIHLHLEGLVSVDTIWTLKEKHNLSFPGVDTKEDLRKKFQVKSLDQFIDMFINIIQASFNEVSDLNLLLRDAEEYLVRNNIFYAEIFFAPTKFLKSGFKFDAMMNLLDDGASRLYEKHGITVCFLIDVSRGFGLDNALRNLNLTLTHRRASVIGIGLGGAESKGRCSEFREVFEIARTEGLKTVAHAGEDLGPESVWEAINDLKVSRIGHGISSIQDPRLMDYLAENRIPLEISPTSNLFTRKFVKTYKEHPIRQFMDHGIIVTLNTDDPTLFNSELVNEYAVLYEEGIFTKSELVSIMKNTLFSTFLPEDTKEHLWINIKKSNHLLFSE